MVHRLPRNGYILGLDVGAARIGAALTSVIARLPQPIDMIPAGESALAQISELVKKEDVALIVVGIPRNMQGEETAQSQSIRDFAKELEMAVSVPITFADESMSSVRADEIGKHNAFQNVSQDSLAACFILEEYLRAVSNLDGEEK